MTERQRELIKLRAAALDRLSTVFLAVGLVSPWVEGGGTLLTSVVSIAVAGLLHYIASKVLGGLPND